MFAKIWKIDPETSEYGGGSFRTEVFINGVAWCTDTTHIVLAKSFPYKYYVEDSDIAPDPMDRATESEVCDLCDELGIEKGKKHKYELVRCIKEVLVNIDSFEPTKRYSYDLDRWLRGTYKSL